MADGSIIIDTKIRTGNVKQDTQNLKKQMERLADSASASAKKIDRAFDGLTIDDAAEGLGESFEKEARKIEPIPEEIEKDFSDIDLEDAAENLSESFEEAWDDVKRETTRGADHVKDKIEDVGDEAEDAGDKIKRGLGDKLKDAFSGLSDKLGDSFAGGLLGGITAGIAEEALDLLGNTGQALVDLGKQAVEAAADVEAANAQFEQTFKGVENAARTSLKAISSETGIAATRLQDSYTKIYAFLRTLGTDTPKALDIAGRAMRAAADQAAYQDKSIEEVTESLQSYLKGNYENDAALNISSTATTRNAKANEMYAKSFDKLSDSQRVDVLLAMVEAGNEASGALGQAAREADSWANVTGELSEAWHQFLGVSGSGMKDVLTPMLQGITNELNKYVEFMGFMKEDDTLVEEFSAAELAAQSTAATVQQLRLEYDQAKEAAHQALLAQVGYFDELSAKSDKSATDIVANWGKQKEAFDQYAANLEKAVQLGLDETLVAQLSDGSEQSMAILNELVNSTDLNIDEINKAFEEVQESRDTVESTMADIKEDMSGKLAEMAGEVETEWGEMAGTVGESIAEMQGYIDGLKGKDVYVNVITRNIGGTSAPKGSVESTLMPSAVSAASVPFLASGAVIPPNAPFAAVLGDQRNGTNLEAPEGLIRDIIREEMSDMIGGMMAGFEAMVAEQQATRTAIEDIQIGDTTIGRAAARYDRRQTLIRGGTTG